jgi:hypothetical protein
VGQVVQTTPDGVLYGVRFGPLELFFLTKDEVGKLKEGATGSAVPRLPNGAGRAGLTRSAT